MVKEEVARILRKIEIVRYWYNDASGGEYSVSIIQAQELIELLEGVNENGKE